MEHLPPRLLPARSPRGALPPPTRLSLRSARSALRPEGLLRAGEGPTRGTTGRGTAGAGRVRPGRRDRDLHGRSADLEAHSADHEDHPGDGKDERRILLRLTLVRALRRDLVIPRPRAPLGRDAGPEERGNHAAHREERAFQLVERAWVTWRGRAVEPGIRESLLRLLPNHHWPETDAVGGWWNRQNNPEIDLVGADREPTADALQFVGSIKWLESQRFGARDFDDLRSSAAAVPGADGRTPLVAVSRCGFVRGVPLAARWGPGDLVGAWR
ncbi:MAG: hypothetical protein GEV11_12030 [Streptosporangiales bacterium]|nr:hypothetical protein [Streptosporangiales bacterium]